MILRKILFPLVFLTGYSLAGRATAQQPDLSEIARELIRSYREPKRETYFENLMRAYIVAGEFTLALRAADSLKQVRSIGPNTLPPVVSFPYEVYATIGLGSSLDSAFAAHARFVDDRAAATVLVYVLGTSLQGIRNNYDSAIARFKAKPNPTHQEILDVVRRRAAVLAYGALDQNIPRLLEADDERRYIIERNIRVPTSHGGIVCAMVFRPRAAKGKLTALLNFTIYDSDQVSYEARRTAANGYAGVEGLTRGKGCSPNTPVSHEYDGIDAAALVNWISTQPWNDGRVGMYGGSYEGMTQWAAAKHMPRALKAMMPSVTHAPGIDFPTDGNIFATYAYPWPLFTTGVKRGLDSATYNDRARWTKLQQTWYRNGTAYRDLPSIDGKPNPVFTRWLNHPAYDSYWQKMVASGSDFRRIDIPILTTTGYFDGGQMGALWFFREHTRHRPDAEHYLLVGPYDHITGQRGNLDPLGRRSQSNIQGVDVDSVASIDIGELRYQWFDYVFKGKPRPSLLKDKVNYVVMKANVWKHAPTLAAMSDSLVPVRLGSSVSQRVDLADRRDLNAWGPSGDLLDPSSSVRSLIDTIPNIANAITFMSGNFDEAVEVSGLFSGEIDFTANKGDFDFSVTVFELTPDGKYVQLSYHWQRASFAKSRSTREVLVPGRRTQLRYSSNRLVSRRLQLGSRIAVVISIPKNPSQQINYGTGKDVADETIADAKIPLTITWHANTLVRVPVKRQDRK